MESRRPLTLQTAALHGPGDKPKWENGNHGLHGFDGLLESYED
jgi:hypothetical protein